MVRKLSPFRRNTRSMNRYDRSIPRARQFSVATCAFDIDRSRCDNAANGRRMFRSHTSTIAVFASGPYSRSVRSYPSSRSAIALGQRQLDAVSAPGIINVIVRQSALLYNFESTVLPRELRIATVDLCEWLFPSEVRLKRRRRTNIRA